MGTQNRGHVGCRLWRVKINFSIMACIEATWVVSCFSHTCFSVCPPPEMIYRHMAVIDGEMVHFEILDTAGQVSSCRFIAG